ncbi:MAG: WYL domain-containing protein [Muribaculaceae bacterium]|nr:WYL domain-containing protein [Muribaculaceae bacterium]
MPRDLISRYVWIVDTLNRYGKLSRRQLSDLWMRSSFSDGEPIPERTFFHYRRAIEENFHIDINCTRDGLYYIDQDTTRRNRTFTNWLLDSFAVNNALKDARHTEGCIEVEDVPSAREFLPTVLEAIGNNRKLTFTYAGFSRSRPERDISFCPYFVKRYKQRWYMIGRKDGARDKSDAIRTYALDRVQEMKIGTDSFRRPSDFNPAEYFEHIVGVTKSKGAVRTVCLRAAYQQAK